MPGTGCRYACGASIDSAFGGDRQERRIKRVFGFRLVLERVDKRDLLDGFLHPGNLDPTEAVRSHFGRHDVIPDGHAQTLELNVFFRGTVTPEDGVDGIGRAPDDFLETSG